MTTTRDVAPGRPASPSVPRRVERRGTVCSYRKMKSPPASENFVGPPSGAHTQQADTWTQGVERRADSEGRTRPPLGEPPAAELDRSRVVGPVEARADRDRFGGNGRAVVRPPAPRPTTPHAGEREKVHHSPEARRVDSTLRPPPPAPETESPHPLPFPRVRRVALTRPTDASIAAGDAESPTAAVRCPADP